MSEFTHTLVYLNGTKIERIPCINPLVTDTDVTVQRLVPHNQITGTYEWVTLQVFRPHIYALEEQ